DLQDTFLRSPSADLLGRDLQDSRRGAWWPVVGDELRVLRPGAFEVLVRERSRVIDAQRGQRPRVLTVHIQIHEVRIERDGFLQHGTRELPDTLVVRGLADLVDLVVAIAHPSVDCSHPPLDLPTDDDVLRRYSV